MAAPTPPPQLDPLVKVIMDAKVIEVSSTLIAKLEYVSYGEDPTRSVFRTLWGADLFKACINRIGVPPDFDIDTWYAQVKSKSKGKTDPKWAPHLVQQPVQTNWLLSLFELEVKYPGFMTLLHNILDLEDKTYEKLATKSSAEESYDFLGTRNVPLLLGSSTPHPQKMLK